jgi:hypothetical protein
VFTYTQQGYQNMTIASYVETDCTITFQGQEFTAGGAIVTDNEIIAYIGANRALTDWHGNPLGTYKAVSCWETPTSYISHWMYQIEAIVNGVVYTGRSAGMGMVFRGKIKKGKPTSDSWITKSATASLTNNIH